ncbi:MAG: sigma-70 family RNA polymerase sigma factor [Alphaproteobacteria bacterium]
MTASTRLDLPGLILAVAERRDRQAFQSLFLHFAPRLKGYLQQGGADPTTAEEVVQETMINVWRKAHQFDPSKAAVSTWVYTIARNARITHLRRQNRPTPDADDPSMAPEPAPEPLEEVSREQDAVRLRAAVARLPEEQQTILKLAFFEDKAHSAVAEELKLPLGTVKSRIRLAMKRIRAELGEPA